MALTRRALGGITIGGSAALALSACGGGSGGGSGKKEIVWGISSPWEAWNLNTTTGNTSYTNQALTPMNPMGQIGGDFDADANWVQDDAIFAGPGELVSEEPMQIKYTLNENAQWSDGKPIRVEDFIFHWYSMSGNPDHANQEKALPASTDWGANVASIEQAEDGTILVTYVEGYLDPEWEYTGGVYLPSHLAEENGFEAWAEDPEAMGDAIEWFNSTPPTVGSGPYVPTEAKLGEYVVYEINENYQGSVKPTIEKITMKMVEGTEAIVTEIRQGALDGAWPSEFNEEENAKLAEDPAIKQEVFAGSIWMHIDANFKNEFLADLPLRQAVFTAINVKDILEKNYPETEVAPKGNHFFANDSEHFVDYVTPTGQGSGDIEAAKTLLTEAGYTGVGEALKTKDGKAVAFNIRYDETDPFRKTTAELSQAYLAELGIELELVAIPGGELGPVLEGAEFDLIIFGWIGSAAFTVQPEQYFGAESGSNYGSFEDPAVDEAIAKVRSTTDIDESAEFTNAVDELATQGAYILPLLDEPQVVYVNGNVLENAGPNGNSQSGPIWNVREWKIK